MLFIAFVFAISAVVALGLHDPSTRTEQGRLLGVLDALRLLARGDLGLRDLQTAVDLPALAAYLDSLAK